MSINIGVNNIARNVKSAYVGIDGKARQIVKVYVGDENGKARLVWELNKDKLTSYKNRKVLGTVATETLEILGVQKVTDNKIIVCTMDKYQYNAALKAIYVYVINLNDDGSVKDYNRQLIDEQDVDYINLNVYLLSKTASNNYGIISFKNYNPYTGQGSYYLGCFDLNELNGWGGFNLNVNHDGSIELSGDTCFVFHKGNTYGGRIVHFHKTHTQIEEEYYELSQIDSGKKYITNGTGLYIPLSGNRIAYVMGATDSSSSSVKYTAVAIWQYDTYYRFTRIKTEYLPACNIQKIINLGNDKFVIIGNNQAMGFSVDASSNVTYKSVCSHTISTITDAMRIGTTNSIAVFNNNTLGIVHYNPETLETTFSNYGTTPLSYFDCMPYKEHENLMVSLNSSGQLELSTYSYS